MKLDVEVLQSLIENSSLDYRKKNVLGDCPWCGKGEFGISVDENHLFGCFRQSKCGERGNVFKLLKKLNRLDLISNADSVRLTSTSHLENLLEKKSRQLEILPEIKPPVGFRKIATHPYLAERGFMEQDYDRYEVGTTTLDPKLRDYVVFLVRQQSRLVGYVARYIGSKQQIRELEQRTGNRVLRYRNSTTDFESLLLGIDECVMETDTVILVEGLFGKRNVDEKLSLYDQQEVKCLCTFGAKISDSQVLLLHRSGIRNIILFYDPDVVEQVKKYSSRLLDEFESVKVAVIPWEDKDPADLSAEEMSQVLDSLRDVLNFQLNTVSVLKLK